MGIHDREYARDERRAGGGGWGTMAGGGSRAGGIPRIVTVNAWLLIINIAVYAVGGFLNNASVPVFQGHVLQQGVELDQTVLESQFRDGNGQAVDDGAIRRSPGAQVARIRADRETGEPVGSDLYTIMNPLRAYGHFSTYQGFLRLEVWRLLTFQFLHANIYHIFFNMLGLWIFGGMVEQYLGSKRYLAFYLMCGISGGLLYLLFNLVGMTSIPLPGALNVDLTTPLVGASAGVFGVIMACAFISPNTVIQLLFPPIPLKMKTFAYGYLIIAAANLFVLRGANQGGDAAHVGGAIAGFFFIRRPHLLRDFFDVFTDSRKGSKRGAARARAPRAKKQSSASDREVDRILDKVNAEGLHSLSDREKKTLREATEDRRG